MMIQNLEVGVGTEGKQARVYIAGASTGTRHDYRYALMLQIATESIIFLFNIS
jgi:hypothetical protein